MTPEIIFFSDSSFDPVSKTGVAGFMMVLATEVDAALRVTPTVELTSFRNTTCTRLEIESVLIVLQKIREMSLAGTVIYTDCKTVIDLPRRRVKLEAGNYVSKKSAKPLHNADLYRIFYRLSDEVNPNFVWIKGHMAKELRGPLDILFSVVDKVTRTALRQVVGQENV